MAWRPTAYLIEGELDNTVSGTVTGWMSFFGKTKKVLFKLKGDFHQDIRGTKIQFKGRPPVAETERRAFDAQAKIYMGHFGAKQTGDVGDITAGLSPTGCVKYPYIEWYGKENGRVVLELDAGDIKVRGVR